MSDEEAKDTQLNYGIWKRSAGWVRGRDNDPIAFKDKTIADFYARWFGGKAYPVDDSLVDLQDELIEAEKGRSLWHIFGKLTKTLQKKPN